MIAFTLLYALSTYGFLFIGTNQTWAVPILIMLTPAISCVYGTVFAALSTYNNAATIEVLAPTILTSMPDATKAAIYQMYNNPQYQHGEESAARGCFVPNPAGYETFYAQEVHVKTEEEKPLHTEVHPEDNNFVIDLTQQSAEKKDE